jgi:hypothetical protein
VEHWFEVLLVVLSLFAGGAVSRLLPGKQTASNTEPVREDIKQVRDSIEQSVEVARVVVEQEGQDERREIKRAVESDTPEQSVADLLNKRKK